MKFNYAIREQPFCVGYAKVKGCLSYWFIVVYSDSLGGITGFIKENISCTLQSEKIFG